VPTFFWEFLANPISLVLSVAVILLLLNQTPLWPRRRKAAGQETTTLNQNGDAVQVLIANLMVPRRPA
jgi:hypothetical protein